MKDMRHLFLAILLFLLMPGSAGQALANSDENMLYPSSAWLIGPSSLVSVSSEDKGAGLPCIMMNQYNNGFIMRVSGGGGRVMAMAIDFRQDVFKHGNDYSINLSIPQRGFDVTLPAYAYSRQSLLFGTQETRGLYEALKSARALDVTVGKKTISFSMAGIADGMSRMEGCYNAGGEGEAAPEPRQRQARSALPSLQNSKPLKEKNRTPNKAAVADIAPVPAEEEDILIPLPSSQAGVSKEKGILKSKAKETRPMRADKKENAAAVHVEDALAKAEADVAAMEPAAGEGHAPTADVEIFSGGVKSKDSYKNGQKASFEFSEDEESKGHNVAPHWQSPYNMNKGQDEDHPMQHRKREPQDVLISPPVEKEKRFDRPFSGGVIGGEQQPGLGGAHKDKDDFSPSENIRRWRAIRGANLRETLYNWSREANVRLMWKAERDFPVEESFVVQGPYEEAVAKLLDQYRNGERDADDIPSGRLYHDPAAKQKVLLIEQP